MESTWSKELPDGHVPVMVQPNAGFLFVKVKQFTISTIDQFTQYMVQIAEMEGFDSWGVLRHDSRLNPRGS